uniref:YbhB/YbcL family Raf kinase inhibitor-like protein n=1 Tax=Diaphorobacter sp. TaxID=1934310 RepID=UPI002583E4F5
MTAFTLTSPDIADGSTIAQSFEFDGFGCSGRNQSPVLRWSGAPEGTKGFAVNVYDPDAPTGSGFWHWYVIDLPASVSELPANAGAKGGAHLPAGARQIRNDNGQDGWGGGGPPPGAKPHRAIRPVD